MKRYFWKYLTILLAIIFLGMGAVAGIFYYYSKELPPLSELTHFDMKVGSEVYDTNDELIHIFSVERRQLTNLNELPDFLIDGLIAVEDNNFYQHWGMDLFGFVRAVVANIKTLSFSQGGSTITQQLARNMFLTLDKQIPRKIKELLLAVQIEKHYSKQEILEYYFNKAAFGPGLYGIEIAASKYFGKEAKDLNIAEAALLIGMPQLPSGYYPFRYPQRALNRRNFVLKRMLQENVITKQQYTEAVNSKIELHEPEINHGAADYFLEHIRKKLERKYGTTQLFTGGLKIYTTLDMQLQQYADSIMNAQLTKLENRNDYEVKYADFPVDTVNIATDYVQGGIFSIEPQTGYVKVMIGGRNFNHSKLNRMTQSRRQPGSAFKPILYTAALDNGYTPATVIQDEPVSFIQSDTLFWKPHNYSNRYFGYTRLREGLKKSRNIYAAKLIYDLGPEKVTDYARRFGITTPIPPVYSLAAGSLDLIPYELITAYTTFPNNGERVRPIFIRRVEDSQGNILESAEIEKIRVVDESVAYIMTTLLQSVVDEGTGRGVRWQPAVGKHSSISYKWTAAGKTGTTNDFRDAWFIGFHRKLVTGIWVGFDDSRTLGKSQSGAVAALPAWPFIMKKAIYLESPKNNRGKPIVDASQYKFEKPDEVVTVEVSKETGLLPKSEYEKTIKEYFVPGTEPTPLSDSLEYNFIPTAYRMNEMDSLVIDLGGEPYKWPDSTEYEYVRLDTAYKDSMNYFPTLNLAEDMDSLLYFVDGKSYKAPGWVDSLVIVRDSLNLENFSYKFYPELFLQNDIDSLFYYLGGRAHRWPSDSVLRVKHVPDRIDLRGAKIMKEHVYVTRPDSMLYGPDSTEVEYPESIDAIDTLFQEILQE